MTEQWWIFTFGCGQGHAGRYVRIKGSFEEARRKMVDKYGLEWAFQYSIEDWEKMKNNPDRMWKLEAEMEVIE